MLLLFDCSYTSPLDKTRPLTLKKFEQNVDKMLIFCPFLTWLDYRLHVAVYFRETLVREVTVSNLEGCILGVSKDGLPYGAPQGLEFVELPRIEHSSLEQGVLLWMATDGLYARRCCPCRVYWEGGHTSSNNKPNKLQRDQPCKLLDTHQFITG